MDLPFTTEDFLSAIEAYNTAVFPMQVLLNLTAAAIVYFSISKPALTNKFIPISLALLLALDGHCLPALVFC